MATFPAIWDSRSSGSDYTWFGVFVKFPSYPDVDQVIVELNATGIGYQRLILTHGGVIYCEASYYGGYCRAILTPHLVLRTGHWYWCICGMGATDGSLTGRPAGTGYGLLGQVTAADGSSDGPIGEWANPGSHFDNPANANLGWGVSLDAAFGNHHNEPGRVMAQLRVARVNNQVDTVSTHAPPPTTDASCSDIDGSYYPCDIAVGPAPTLPALCTTTLGLDAGPEGLTIVRDSPY